MEMNFGAFIANLYYMGVGMLCIFVVIAVIILSVFVLDKISGAIAKKAAEKVENGQN